jgi:ABC-type bacteriocin/lantibiotic exporter with double-glycine peptidase domain
LIPISYEPKAPSGRIRLYEDKRTRLRKHEDLYERKGVTMIYQINNGLVKYAADTILDHINFEIRNTEKIAVVGRNGCGKTTLSS